MTPTDTIHSAAPVAVSFPTRWLDALRAALRRRHAYQETLAELESLDARALADLGFARCDLPRVARESVLASEGR